MIKILLFALLPFFISCKNKAQNITPGEFRYYTKVNPEIYEKNTKALIDSIKILIRYKSEPYNIKEDDSLTGIFVDTILYSPKYDKIAFFIITKNSNDKLLDKGSKDEFHYNANCFIGQLDSQKNIIVFGNIIEHSLFNFDNQKSTSDRIREVYFKEINMVTNLEGKSVYKYNFDDVRFWDGPVWDSYFHS
jgi:hypothetical protein